MNITQLKKLVKKGESESLEFKKSTGSLSSAMQTVCAFLNSDHGGIIIFGVDDNGHILGQDISDKTRKELATELNKIEPHTPISMSTISLPSKRSVIIIDVESGDKAPYTYDGRAFMRKQSTTMRMPHEVYTYLYNKNNPTLWESLTTNKCTIKDLDKNRIEEVIKTAINERRLTGNSSSKNVTSVLKKLNLIIKSKLTNAAVILFCKNEDKQFMQSTVQLARFKGTTKSEFLNQKLVKTNAFDIYEKVMDFMVFSMPVAAKIEPGKSSRVETPAIPYKVLREALINAIVHRDYSHPGSSIAVAVYDDRITITNPGFLPEGVNIKQLARDHKSIQRNPLIANVFYLCGKIERWGRGTLDMIRECKEAGNPAPKFEEIGGGFSVTLKFKNPIITVTTSTPQLTQRQKKIVSILESGSRNRQQIMTGLRVKISDRMMQLELGKLKKLHLVKSSGKGKALLWSLI